MQFFLHFMFCARILALLSDYERSNIILGEGSHGKVILGIRIRDSLPVAIKFARIPKYIKHEISIYQTIGNQSNIVKMLDFFRVNNSFAIVLERAHMSLKKYLARGRNFTFSKRIMYESILAVSQLHDFGICSRDIKPENFLLIREPDNEGCPIVKLSDFG